MVTVSVDPVEVESQLLAGALACPSCGGRLGPWGWARRRVIRGHDRVQAVTPRRSRCRGCRVTHVLLPAGLLLRRADEVGLIGRAIELVAVGVAVRAVSRLLGRSRSTVRGWIGRFVGRAERRGCTSRPGRCGYRRAGQDRRRRARRSATRLS
jgi:hypothetical protein